jgi:2-polyprenyl-3-methyl-5-hydroxy-6-metoxy-1,4-benzoquinol methylase
MKSALVRLLGFPATLIHGDTLVLDRWLWLKKRLPKPAKGKALLDVGCGTGAFVIGAAGLGFDASGVSWDERNQNVAQERARLCHVDAKFEVLDVRQLDSRKDFVGKFDALVCTENIEHILDDAKLMRDMAACLKPGGAIYLTSPNQDYRPMTKDDLGPFEPIENGGHVRKGYTAERLRELCTDAGLKAEEISFCSGFLSQKTTALLRKLANVNHLAGWAATLPLRILPPLLDGPITSALRWPGFSICLVARKPA